MKKLSIYSILFSIVLCACTAKDEEKALGGSKLPLIIAGSQVRMVTKGVLPPLPAGVSTGVYVTDKDASITSSWFSNTNYLAGASGVLTTPASVDLTIGRSYDIYAYAPYKATASNPYAVDYPHGSDVLCSGKFTLADVSVSNHTANLVFEHKASQISFNVGFASDFNAGTKVITSSSTLQVTGFYDRGSLNVATGIYSPVGTASTVLNASGTGIPGAMALAIASTCFVPSASPMTMGVTVIHEGRNYNAVITGTFLPGTAYNYTITLKGYSPNLQINGTVVDWIPVLDNVTIQ